MAEFSLVRTKAQDILVQKENEIKRLKEKTIGGRKGTGKDQSRNLNNSGIDSDDALSQVYQSDNSSSDDEDSLAPKIRRAAKPNRSDGGFEGRDTISRTFIKTVLIKYLECMANQQEKETLMMEKVLFTALKVHEVELKMVQEARLRSLNSGWMGYFWAHDSKVVATAV